MMILPALLLLGLLLGTTPMAAQDDQTDTGEFDDFNFDNIPIDDYRELDYVGFGLGYLGNYAMLPLDEVNAIGEQFGMDEMGPGVISHGFGVFFGGIGFRNIRYGFYNQGGSKSVLREVTVDDVEYNRKLVFSQQLLSFQLDYAIFLPWQEGLVLFPGVAISRETAELELFQIRNEGLEFSQLFNPNDYNSIDTVTVENNRYGRIERTSFQIRPMVSLDYAINYFLVARAGAGYSFNLAGDWNHASGDPIDGVPDIKSDGLLFQFGLFVGLFQK